MSAENCWFSFLLKEGTGFPCGESEREEGETALASKTRIDWVMSAPSFFVCCGAEDQT
jgi:hypothetical protein